MGTSRLAAHRFALPLLWTLAACSGAAAAALPRVVAISPVDGARWVRPATSILVRFDRDAGLPRTALSGVVVVNGSKSGPHAGRTHVTRDGTALLFDPAEPFALGEHVTVAVEAGATPDPGALGTSRSFGFDITPRLLDPSPALAELDAEAFPAPLQSVAPRNSRGPWPAAVLDVPADFPPIDVQQWGPTGPGLLFMANLYFFTQLGRPFLMILDDLGQPVWYRAMQATCLDFKPQGEGRYSYYDFTLQAYTVLDSLMNPVDTWACGNGYTTDLHELRLLPDGNALLLSYDPEPVDMSTIVPGGDSAAVVTGLIIQELDYDKNVVFQWRSWDHFQITDCMGIDLTRPTIDYVHGNALEVDADGNLLLSSRHMSEITKIDRSSGAILWRWGGAHNQFTFVDDSLQFSYQHAIRRIANGHYTLFDNGNQRTPPFSRACEYALDEPNRTATLVWSYRDTPDAFGGAMGYVQRLDNGNTLIGYGSGKPDVIEVNAAGEKVLELSYLNAGSSYRALRGSWTPPGLSVETAGSAPELSLLGSNPVHGSTALMARLPHAGTASVTLYDLQGRAIATPLPPCARPAGLLSLPVSFAGRPGGVYFCRVQLDGQSVVRRLVVVR